ncbi:hypothetical protein [Luteolibacter sp. AS25]|uniref:hypothetical protein n=1 Tax=Luteolibacter sp. AS25 TaxID=3135776 RepID=UPI00398AE8ED
MDVIPEISLGTAALVIFGFCAGYMLLRGVARTFINTAFLLVSAWVGFRIWQQAPSLSLEWIGKPSQVIEIGLPIAAALFTLILLRKLLKSLFRSPLETNSEDNGSERSTPLLLRLIFTLIPAAFICITAATFLHHASAVAELKNSTEPSNSSQEKLAERIKNSISVAIPESWMDKLDPLTTQPRLQLAKLIASELNTPLEPIIDPETGKPYPRAIIVDDPELTALANEGRFSALLRHPLLTEALKDPTVRKSLGLN